MYDEVKKTAGKNRIPMAAYVRMCVFQYIQKKPLPVLAAPPPEDKIHLIKEVSPNAIVYVIPISGVRVIASADTVNGGWRGICFDPEVKGTVSVWNSSNLNPPNWAKTPTIAKAMFTIASRIDIDNISYFEPVTSKLKISAIWNGEEFTSGEVIDTEKKIRQSWTKAGWYSQMLNEDGTVGPFNHLSNIRRILNMLCRTYRVGSGGIGKPVPS